MPNSLVNMAWDVKFSRKYRSGMQNSLENATRGCQVSWDSEFPRIYGFGDAKWPEVIPNSLVNMVREYQIPYDTGLNFTYNTRDTDKTETAGTTLF